MSIEEIEHMRKTVRHGHRNANDLIWQKAFKEYNEAMKEIRTYPLQMGCGACYGKILMWCLGIPEPKPLPKYNTDFPT